MGLVTGSHAHTPRTLSEWVAGAGRTPQGRAVGRGRAPNPGRPRGRQEAQPPGALVPFPQPAKPAPAVRLVTGPYAHIPRTLSQWVAGPGRTPQGQAIGRGRAPDPRRLKRRQEAPSPAALVPPPESTKSARKSVPFWVGDGSPRLHTLHQQPVGSGPRPHARRTGGRAWESAPWTADTLYPGNRRPPPSALVPPPQRAKAARKSARCGVGSGSPCRQPPQPQPVRSGPRPHAPRTRGWVWESAQPRTPPTQAEGTPPGHPCAAPTASKASWQERALWR